MDRPDAIGPRCSIRSIDDVDAALHELAWLQREEQQAEATCKAAIAQANATKREQLKLQVGQQQTTIPERAAALRDSVAAWADEHLAEHLPSGRKSIDLTHGSLAVRTLPPAVELDDGLDDAAVIARIDKTSGLLAWLGKLLARACGKLALSDLVVMKPALNRTAIKVAWQSGDAQREQLRKLGLSLREDGAKLEINPGA